MKNSQNTYDPCGVVNIEYAKRTTLYLLQRGIPAVTNATLIASIVLFWLGLDSLIGC